MSKTPIDTQAFAHLFRHAVVRLHGLPDEFVKQAKCQLADGQSTSDTLPK